MTAVPDLVAALERVKSICEGDAEGEHGYTGSELAEVILDVLTPVAMFANAAARDYEYMFERGGILSTAVGLARVLLEGGDHATALATLDNAAAETHVLLYDTMVAAGHPPDRIEMLIGPREGRGRD